MDPEREDYAEPYAPWKPGDLWGCGILIGIAVAIALCCLCYLLPYLA
jgi:hypothetical protein